MTFPEKCIFGGQMTTESVAPLEKSGRDQSARRVSATSRREESARPVGEKSRRDQLARRVAKKDCDQVGNDSNDDGRHDEIF